MDFTLLKAGEIFLLLFLPGYLTLLAAFRKERQTFPGGRGEFCFLAILISFSFSSLSGLVLAYLNVFSVFKVAVSLLLYSLLILLFFRPSFRLSLFSPGLSKNNGGSSKLRPHRSEDATHFVASHLPMRRLNRTKMALPKLFINSPSRVDKASAFILIAILILAALLFFRPVEYVFGGWDPGVYANTAVHIFRTGSIVVEDRLLASFSPEEKETFAQRHKQGYPEKYPGFRLGEGGRLIPQFYHLFPVWLAVFYSWGGLAGMFYLTPVLGILSLLAVYLAARELWDDNVALVAVFLLSINIVQIWQARFPTSEMLSQFLLFSGIFTLVRFLTKGEKYFGWLAGLALGVFLLSRISAFLIAFPLIIFFYLRWFIRFRREDLNFWGVLAVLAAASLLPHLIFGPRYARSVLGNLVLEGVPWKIILVLVGVVAAGMRLLPRGRREEFVRFFSKRFWRALVFILLLGLLWYGYFVRPYLGPPGLDKSNLIELGWLLSPLGLLAGSLGMGLLVWVNRKAGVWFFLLVIAAFSGIFLWQQMIHQVYMWAARRYAVAVVPGFVLFAAWFIVRLSASRLRWLALVLVILISAHTAYSSRVLWSHREYRGAVDFADRLSSRVRGADLVIVGGEFVDKIPTLLDLTYGCAVLPVYRDDPVLRGKIPALARRYLRQRYPRSHKREPDIYFLTSGPPPPLPGADFEPEAELSLDSLILERRWEYLPRKVDESSRDANFTVRVYRMRLRED